MSVRRGDVVDPWQIYSASPTGDVFNGLDSGTTAVWNTTFGQPVTAAGNRYIFAFQPTITVTSGDLTKTYGQDVTSLVAADYHHQRPAAGGRRRLPRRSATAVYSGAPSVTSLGSPARASVAAARIRSRSRQAASRFRQVRSRPRSGGRLDGRPARADLRRRRRKLDLRNDADPRRSDAVWRASRRYGRPDRRRLLGLTLRSRSNPFTPVRANTPNS